MELMVVTAVGRDDSWDSWRSLYHPTRLVGCVRDGRPWLLLIWAISQDCVCSEKPWKMRQCLPLGQTAGLFTASYKSSGSPTLSVPALQCDALWVWAFTWAPGVSPMRLGHQKETDCDVLRLVLLAVQWVMKSFVFDAGVSCLLSASRKQEQVHLIAV